MTKDTKWIRNPEYDNATHELEHFFSADCVVDSSNPNSIEELKEFGKTSARILRDQIIDGREL